MSTRQMSESIPLGILLALAGGFMDAYSYLYRGGVFANAQTGNILLLGVNLAQRQWAVSLHYLFPILSFVAGILLSNLLRACFRNASRLHWRQPVLVVESAIFLVVGFLPLTANQLANCLISMACGIQVESFRTINGHPAATTMCIGNLRDATRSLWECWTTRDRAAGRKSLLLGGVILCFMLGAVCGDLCLDRWGGQAIWVCVALLLAGAAVMARNGKTTG